MHRRTFLKAVPLLRPGALQLALAASSSGATPEAAARDEDYWRTIQSAFPVDRTIIDLNNGGVCPSPRVVQDALIRYIQYSNEAPVYTMWRILEPAKESIRKSLAASFGCDAEELAVTRGATESLEICQLGLNLKPGDEVLTTDQDYPRMLDTFRQRERREGIVLKTFSFPTPPPSLDDLYTRFERAITPRTKVILLCHMTYTTGQIFPVQRICRMARERGIETIVDGAHSYSHFPFKVSDLECDYFGASLHKWLLAPHGTGFLYVRKDKIANLWPLNPASEDLKANIRKFEQVGTHPAANHNAVAEALVFTEAIGVDRKAARLRYLRDRWVTRASKLPGAKLRTNLDPQQSCGMAVMSFEGRDHAKLNSQLWDRRRILVTTIGREDFQGIRVSPNIYTTLGEMDVFCDTLEALVGT